MLRDVREINMNRRAFLRLVALSVANHALDLDRLLWVPGAKKIFIPTAKQIEFFNDSRPYSLYGIPYHESNATTGKWLGFERKIMGIKLDP